MKPNDFAALLKRVESGCQNETHEDDELAARFIEREIDRAVRKARREERKRAGAQVAIMQMRELAKKERR